MKLIIEMFKGCTNYFEDVWLLWMWFKITNGFETNNEYGKMITCFEWYDLYEIM